MKKSVDWKVLAVSFIIVYLVAFLGRMFTSPGIKTYWYKAIKPGITPPDYIFPLVWSILFFLIALSLYFSWTNSKNEKIKMKIFFAYSINFLLNILWSFFYFKLKNTRLAFFDLILLWISIAGMIKINWDVDRKSSYLLIPYLLWVSFAGILNWMSIK